MFNWARDEDNPQPHSAVPDSILDLSELKQAALGTSTPRAFFDSYALYILSVAQTYLTEFFRDGPTDDIPFYRHLIYAEGMEGDDRPIWIKNVLFSWDDQHG